jgi:hypothetical protein
MKRYRINTSDQIVIFARYKGELIEKQMYFGYSSLKEIKSKFLACLDYEFRNKGKRIELTIWNTNTDQYKYIDTFS